MSAEDLENYETDMELQLYREYRDVVGLFKYVIETERRFYLTNQVELNVRAAENTDAASAPTKPCRSASARTATRSWRSASELSRQSV